MGVPLLLFRPPKKKITASPPEPVVSWYLAGGIDPANCIAAYQPIGAADLATSYVNLANPGTYDAAPGTAPAFNTATGWAFTAASSQYLTTGIIPNTNLGNWSMIVQFADIADANNMYACGLLSSGTTRFYLVPRSAAGASGDVRYRNGADDTNFNIVPAMTSGNIAVAGRYAYRNGTAESGTMGAWSGTPTHGVFIGAYNAAGSPSSYMTGKISSLAIYNTTLTPAQVAAVYARMAVLPL